jgi:SAM-dependent methyltransferase
MRFLDRVYLHWTDYLPEMETHAREMKSLHIGCGQDKIEGASSLDIRAEVQPDLVHNLDTFPWPIPDDTFDCVIALNIIEHLYNTEKVMEELFRISKNGALIYILIPHYSSSSAFTDPTHVKYLGGRSLDYFLPNTVLGARYGYYGKCRFRKEVMLVSLQKFWNRVPFLAKLISKYPDPWEDYFCYIIRGAGLFWKLRVLK